MPPSVRARSPVILDPLTPFLNAPEVVLLEARDDRQGVLRGLQVMVEHLVSGGRKCHIFTLTRESFLAERRQKYL